ncbi:MFS transporter [Geodermatophilus sp. SYSU D00079]
MIPRDGRRAAIAVGTSGGAAVRRTRDLSAGLLVPLCLGAVLNPVNSTMIATALSPIGREFGVGAAATSWLISVMYLASAIGQPVAGRLADQFGPRRVFLAGSLLVAVAGVVGALGPTFGWVVAARAVVGLGTGALYPAAVTMVREQADRLGIQVPARALGLLNTTGLVTLAVGPPLGGVLVDTVGWRAVFAINVPLGLLVTALALRHLPRSRRRERQVAAWRLLDLPGVALFSGAVTLMLLVLTELPRPRWYLASGLAVCVVLLVVVELRSRVPFLDVRMLGRNPALVVTYLRVALTFVVVYGVLFGFTPWLQESRGLSASTAGSVLLGMSAVGALVSLFGARGQRPLWPLLVSAVGLLAGSLAMTVLGSATPIAVLACVAAVFGLPNGMGLVANQVVVYRVAPAEQVGAATGLFRTAQYTGAMLATSITGLAYAREVGDTGLHAMGWAFIAAGFVLLVVTVADPTLRCRR